MKTIFKIFWILLITIIIHPVHTQVPTFGVWPSGVVLTDINGNTYDLDEILDSNRPIVIDAFATWCGPCWSYHSTHAFEQLYQNYGLPGTNEVAVFAVETDPSTPVSEIWSNGYEDIGDWTQGVSYPMVNDDMLGYIINQRFYPTIFYICPDRSVDYVGNLTAEELYAITSACPSASNNSVDPRLLLNLSEDEFCPDESARIRAVLQNFGTTILNNATIEVFDGNTSVLTKEWQGSLIPYDYNIVTIGELSPPTSTDYEIRITSQNENTDNDVMPTIVSPVQVLKVNEVAKKIEFDLDTDNFKNEVGFLLKEGSIPRDQILISIYYEAIDDPSTVLGIFPFETLEYGEGKISQIWSVNNEGCHFALFADSYSDGYTYNHPEAYIKVKGVDGTEISLDPHFRQTIARAFDVQFTDILDIDELDKFSDVKIYPNPASTVLNIKVTAPVTDKGILTIYDNLGQLVKTQKIGSLADDQSLQIDVSRLDTGVYFVKINTSKFERVGKVVIE